MASSGSGVVRWIVNQMPTKNKLGNTFSIAKEMSNFHFTYQALLFGGKPPDLPQVMTRILRAPWLPHSKIA
jgi:hypothetical protein